MVIPGAALKTSRASNCWNPGMCHVQWCPRCWGGQGSGFFWKGDWGWDDCDGTPILAQFSVDVPPFPRFLWRTICCSPTLSLLKMETLTPRHELWWIEANPRWLDRKMIDINIEIDGLGGFHGFYTALDIFFGSFWDSYPHSVGPDEAFAQLRRLWSCASSMTRN